MSSTKPQLPQVGQSFHSFNADGTLQYEGQIAASLGNGSYLVNVRDWLTGRLDGEKILAFDESTVWRLYESDLESRRAFNALLREGRAGGVYQDERNPS